MEVGGRKLRQSLYQGSDDVQDFPCSPCAKEGKNIAAVKHCVECDENMCSTCLNHHNKFSSMKGHQLLDTVKNPSGEILELPSQRCDKHGGKLIDVYCPNHDQVCCATCIAVKHSTCRGISFIPDIAKHAKSSEELQLLDTSISSLQSRFIALKQKKQANLDVLKEDKDQLQQEIRSERKKINDELDKMEKQLLSEVDSTFQMRMQSLDSSINEVEETLASLRFDQHKIKAAKSENVSEQYVQVKLMHEKMNIFKDLLENVERSSKLGTMWFDPYNQITTFKNNIIGRVINYSAVEVGRFIGEFDATVGSDNAICDITDMCSCADGNIMITDYNNKRIKKMTKSYTVTSALTVNDNPFGICQIDASLLAVTLINKKKVQFISLKEPMTLQKSFDVGDRCRGIACKDGLIYVCCGGSLGREDEGVGHIEVYTAAGALMKAYYGEMGCPGKVTVPSCERQIYITDAIGDVLIVNRGDRMRHMRQKDTKLAQPSAFSWINTSQMCISGCTSNNIVLVSSDGKLHEQLLTEKDGISSVSGICFNEKQSRLVVSSFDSNKVKVYNLNINTC